MISTIMKYGGWDRCLLCHLVVDENGNADRRFYNDQQIAKFNSIPEDQKCKHEKLDNVKELIDAAKSLLEWVPICSVGSSGYLRQEALKKAIARFE